MGRLFWKFFFFILLAQLMAIITIGGTFWLKDHTGNNTNHIPSHSMFPPEKSLFDAIGATLQYSGITAVKALIQSEPTYHAIFVIDDTGRDILERPVDTQQTADNEAYTSNHLPLFVRQITTPDGQRYTLLFDGRSHFPPSPSNAMPTPPFFPDDVPHPPPHGAPFMHLIPIISAIIASLVFAIILAWYFSKPIKHLRTAFKAVAGGNFTPQAAAIMGKRHDELAYLGHDVDQMAHQLHTLIEGQQRLLHDVSHELRSPLARIQVLIGLAKQQPAQALQYMDRIERESVRMHHLIDELLTLSRLEAGVQQPYTEKIDMQELLEDIIGDAQLEASEKHCQIQHLNECHLFITANPEMLTRAIENVLRNAVKHTTNNSIITIETHHNTQEHTVYIGINDCGSGVPEKDLEKIFKPFFRSDNAVNRTQGYGMGLAIAQQVIKTYGGTMRAKNLTPTGFCIGITLPVTVD